MDTEDLTATVREARKDRDDWKAIADAQAQIIDRDVEAQREFEECIAIARESREAAIARTNIATIQLLNVQRNFEEMRNQRDSHRDRANVAEQYLTTARAALLEIGQLALNDRDLGQCAQILELVQGIVGTIILREPYDFAKTDQARGPFWPAGAGPNACTVRDTSTDQSRIRNVPGGPQDEITQAEREEFWEHTPSACWARSAAANTGTTFAIPGFATAASEPCPGWPPPGTPCGACATVHDEPFMWIVLEVDGVRWHEVGRVPAENAEDAINTVAADVQPASWFADAARTMVAIPLESLSSEYLLTTTTQTSVDVTVTPKDA